MRGIERVAATLIIWSVVVISIVMITIGDAYNFVGAFMFFMVAIAALIGTEKIWESRSNSGDEQSEKRKRNEPDDQRVDLLLRLMDDYDKQALKERLLDELSSDGELIALEDLLRTKDRR